MESGAGSLEARPGVLLVGAPGVGKRTILSRLLAAEIPDTHDLSSGVLCQGNHPSLLSRAGLLMLMFRGLSVNGDSQGLERLFGALSAHMWPGMILKSGNRITAPSLVEKEESTDDESNYEFEYEVLSHGSDEQWEFIGGSSTSRDWELNEDTAAHDKTHQVVDVDADADADANSVASNSLPNGRMTETAEEKLVSQNHKSEVNNNMDNTQADTSEELQAGTPDPDVNKLFEDEHYGLDDLERLMSEIGNMRSNLRFMPDFQRREMAAQLAMKMAAMFGDNEEEVSEDI